MITAESYNVVLMYFKHVNRKYEVSADHYIAGTLLPVLIAL